MRSVRFWPYHGAMHDQDRFMASLGFPKTYRVGGSVRDELLQREAKDDDYVIRGADLGSIRQALIERAADVEPLKLRDTRQVGWRTHTERFGDLEISIPRREISTGPGHRDFKIICDPQGSLHVDAQRRDFTINALYKNVHTGEVLDPLNSGLEDLERRWIRTTHPDSFRDDPLRTLRALRFLSSLPGRFDLVDSTFQEMTTHAESVTALTLKGVSDTALSELERILMGPRVRTAMNYMLETGVLPVLLPELSSIIGFEQESAYHDKQLHDHIFTSLHAAAMLQASLRVRMALLFHDAGKPWMAWEDASGHKHYYALTPKDARAINAPPTAVYSHEWWGAWLAGNALERLNAPSSLRRDVTTLIERHMLPLQKKVRAIKVHTWRAELGDELLNDLIVHRECDVLGKGNDESAQEALKMLRGIRVTHERAIADSVPRSVAELAIDGLNLKAIGITGPACGEILRALLQEVMAQPKLNDFEWLRSRATRLAKRDTL